VLEYCALAELHPANARLGMLSIDTLETAVIELLPIHPFNLVDRSEHLFTSIAR